MSSDAIQLMKAFFLPAPGETLEQEWRPPTDVYRTADGWLVKFDLAGVDQQDVRLEVGGCRLTVSGHRRDWCVAEGCHYHMMEIAYNRFERTIVFPEDLQRARITTDFRLGFLLVRLHKEIDR